MINTERMLNLFMEMVKISSISKREREFCDFLKPLFIELGGIVYEDNAAELTGGNSGNLLITFPGDSQDDEFSETLILSAHMDTVSPGVGVVPINNGDTIVSEGETILGADDKAGIAIIIEVLRVLRENNPLNRFEVVLTVSEEIGLVGAKQLEHKRLKGKHCIALDTEKGGVVVTRAPALNRVNFSICGKDAHAGMCPERGINAIQIAAEAISKMSLGRIDYETTANIGIISGGKANNIVPKDVVLKGEARSHDPQKLKKQTDDMRDCVRRAVDKYSAVNFKASFTEDIWMDFPHLDTPESGTLVRHIKKVSKEIKLEKAGGGSDANIFQSYGIESVIVGLGMENPHTTNETLHISEFKKTAEFILATLESWIQN